MDNLQAIDGMLPGQDGNWFSYSYDVWDGRVVRVSFFNHRGITSAETYFFLGAKSA